MAEYIEAKGVRVNNLKNIDLRLPRGEFIVISGVSGSGKSSLAFDTLYAEGQRRYVESLSGYARQFLARMAKPECDYIKGLPPAIAIGQKTVARNPRSTVGTSTEIYEYLRLLFARIGHTFSPVSGREVKRHTAEDIVAFAVGRSEGEAFTVLVPFSPPDGVSPGKALLVKQQEGYNRLYFRGDFVRIDSFLEAHGADIDRIECNEINIVIDRLRTARDKEFVSRLYDTVETALYEGRGICRLLFAGSGGPAEFSTRFEADGLTFEPPSDALFAFNSPAGACPRCEGFGSIIGIDEKLVVPNPALSVYDGCVQCWHGEKMGVWRDEFCRRAALDDFPVFTPYHELTKEQKGQLWHGLPSDLAQHDPAGVVSIDAFFKMLEGSLYKIQNRIILNRFRGKTVCPECNGTRLRREATYVKIGGKDITQLVTMPVKELKEWFDALVLPDNEAAVAKRLLGEIMSRLQFLLDVGLGYLTLNRTSNTLSGGESQRINLTTSLGSALVGSLYILDEPSMGLHSRDTGRLIHALKELRASGNTVVVVEHDEDIIRAADYLVDIGPGAGTHGGEIVFAGKASLLSAGGAQLTSRYPRSRTIKYLAGEETIPVPSPRRNSTYAIRLNTCFLNNLKGITADFPLNVLTVVTGVSGSGKSSLVRGILYPAVKRRLGETCEPPGDFGGIAGDVERIKRVEMVDRSSIGKSTRSNPATYLKAYDAIRALFAAQQLSRQMNYGPQYFSFNAPGGRCEECKGAGTVVVEMQFMADIELVCDACGGRRFKSEVLEVEYEGKNISDVLNLTVDEAMAFFSEHKQKAITERLRPLADVGLGYIKLGQNSSTLSGGENQRVKLAYYLAQEKDEPTLFIFDEPTIGLHFHDIRRLLSAFDALIRRGHTVVVVEHNPDVIKCADHIIDLGPEGGDEGGNLVFAGTPEGLAECETSITGRYIKNKL
ncbi:MAG: excinuclease ABC subunit UvrA [Prevotella sp.]|nr:excinuclease ABC subunit UvrA [Prevotella sp.]